MSPTTGSSRLPIEGSFRRQGEVPYRSGRTTSGSLPTTPPGAVRTVRGGHPSTRRGPSEGRPPASDRTSIIAVWTSSTDRSVGRRTCPDGRGAPPAGGPEGGVPGTAEAAGTRPLCASGTPSRWTGAAGIVEGGGAGSCSGSRRPGTHVRQACVGRPISRRRDAPGGGEPYGATSSWPAAGSTPAEPRGRRGRRARSRGPQPRPAVPRLAEGEPLLVPAGIHLGDHHALAGRVDHQVVAEVDADVADLVVGRGASVVAEEHQVARLQLRYESRAATGVERAIRTSSGRRSARARRTARRDRGRRPARRSRSSRSLRAPSGDR